MLKNDGKKWSKTLFWNSPSCCSVQKNLPIKAELAQQVSRYLWRGLVNFKIDFRPLFTIIFKLKNDNFKTRDFNALIERVLAGVTLCADKLYVYNSPNFSLLLHPCDQSICSYIKTDCIVQPHKKLVIKYSRHIHSFDRSTEYQLVTGWWFSESLFFVQFCLSSLTWVSVWVSYSNTVKSRVLTPLV